MEIMVTGLSSSTSKSKLFDMFEQFGPISEIDLIIDNRGEETKHICFITMPHTDEGQAAIEALTYSKLDGHYITVKEAIVSKEQFVTEIQNERKDNNFRLSSDESKEFKRLRKENADYRNLVQSILYKLNIRNFHGDIPELSTLILRRISEASIAHVNREGESNIFANQLIREIAKGQTQKVLEQLFSYANDSSDKDLLANCTKLMSRFQILKENRSNMLIDDEKVIIETSRINNSLIDLLLKL